MKLSLTIKTQLAMLLVYHDNYTCLQFLQKIREILNYIESSCPVE